MSWGYFLDARLTLPTASWKSLASRRCGEFATPLGWWGLKDRELERRFIDSCGDVSRALSFKKLVDRFARAQGARGEVKTKGGVTTVRVLTLLDRSGDTDLARGVAALFVAAAPLGGEGAVSLVNDGTYVGEDGATVTLEGGALARAPVDDCWELTERYAAELFGDEEEVEERAEEEAAEPAPPSADTFVALSAQLANRGDAKGLFRAFIEYLDAGGEPTPGAVCNGLHPIVGGLKPGADFVDRRFPKLLEVALSSREFRAHQVAIVQLGVALDRMPKHRARFLELGVPHRKEASAGLHAQLVWHAFASKNDDALGELLEVVDRALKKNPRHLDAETYTFDNLAAAALRRGEPARAIGYLRQLREADPARFPETRTDPGLKRLRKHPDFEALFARPVRRRVKQARARNS